jgi:hypothetical protein
MLILSWSSILRISINRAIRDIVCLITMRERKESARASSRGNLLRRSSRFGYEGRVLTKAGEYLMEIEKLQAVKQSTENGRHSFSRKRQPPVVCSQKRDRSCWGFRDPIQALN